MDAERLAKISRDNIPAGRRYPKEMERLNPWLKQAESSKRKK